MGAEAETPLYGVIGQDDVFEGVVYDRAGQTVDLLLVSALVFTVAGRYGGTVKVTRALGAGVDRDVTAQGHYAVTLPHSVKAAAGLRAGRYSYTLLLTDAALARDVVAKGPLYLAGSAT